MPVVEWAGGVRRAASWVAPRAERAPLELHGSLHPAFGEVAERFRALLAGQRGGGAVCVYHRGEPVVDLWAGVRDASGRPWRRDTLAPSFSTTKGVASTLVHILVDRGLLDYDAPVARYWPEFAAEGKGSIRLRQILCHEAGLYSIRDMVDDASRMLDWEYMVRALERARPAHEPGARAAYHGLTYGFLVGEILQRVTGESFPQLVERELAAPLGLDGLFVGAPDEALQRAAELVWPTVLDGLAEEPWARRVRDGASQLAELGYTSSRWLRRSLKPLGVHLDLHSPIDALMPRGMSDFDFSAHETLRVPIPAGNGLFTARSLARMYATLAAGGALDGVRLLSRRTLDEATRRQPAPPGRAVLPFDMRWRLGYHGVFTTAGAPSRAFGHFGFGGSGAWADPRRNLAVAFIVNFGLGTPFGDTRTARISGAVLRCVARRDAHRRRPV